tara:strand:- start:12009 stop:12896 length:888 start_codon:yes stop_codon:yes gene_type:complete
MISSEIYRKVRQIEITTKEMVRDTFSGAYQSVFKGQGMEFQEVRPYNPGDEIRFIDWNVTARMGSPYIRQYREQRERTVMIVLDASQSSNFGSAYRFKRELSAEISAVIAFAATNNNDKVGLIIFTDKIELYVPPKKGRTHVLRIIREMIAFNASGAGTDIALALETVNRVLRKHSIIFFISDFLTRAENYSQSISITNRRHDIIAIDVHDPLEKNIPSMGLMMLEDSETSEFHAIDTSDPDWRKAFTAKVTDFTASKLDVFHKAGVDRIPVNTENDYINDLALFFRKRARKFKS